MDHVSPPCSDDGLPWYGLARDSLVAPRVLWMDVARGMSILLVVFLHAHVFLAAQNLSADIYQVMNTAFNPVRMPLFFCVSGLLAAGALAKGASFVLHRKIVFFASLFVLWSAVHILFFSYVPRHPAAFYEEGFASMWLQGLWRPETAIWFIWALAFYFAFALGVAKRPRLAVGLALAGGLFGASNVMLSWGYSAPQQNLFTYLPFFVIPALSARWLPALHVRGAVSMVLGGALLTVLSKAGLALSGEPFPDGLLGMTKLAGGMAVGVGASFLLAQVALTRAVFSYLGRHTLAIYLIHPLLLGLMVDAAIRLPDAVVTPYGTALATVLSVILCLGVEKLIRWSRSDWLFQPGLAGAALLNRIKRLQCRAMPGDSPVRSCAGLPQKRETPQLSAAKGGRSGC